MRLEPASQLWKGKFEGNRFLQHFTFNINVDPLACSKTSLIVGEE